MGKIAQADLDNDNIDLWLLVTTADISAQDNQDYEKACSRRGISYSNLFAGSNQKYLEALCIIEKKCLLDFFEKRAEFKKSEKKDLKSLKAYFNNASKQDFSSKKKKIINSFLPANIGFHAFKSVSHNYFDAALQSETRSMSRLRQKLDIQQEPILFTDRKAVYQALNNWLKEWGDTRNFAVVTGGEGNGKSWAVAKWLLTLMQRGNTPPIIFLNSSDCSSNNLTELLAQKIKRLSNNNKDDVFWQHKVKNWFQVKSKKPRLVLVIDGINEYHDANWWRAFINNYQSDFSGTVSLIITSRQNYWSNNFDLDKYFKSERIDVKEFNDKELEESLACIKKKVSEFPSAVLPMLRKPRYFQLVNDLLPELKNDPEAITPERLCYEDIKKRWSNKENRQITNTEFENLIQTLAH